MNTGLNRAIEASQGGLLREIDLLLEENRELKQRKLVHEWDEMDPIAFAKELEWRESTRVIGR